MKRKFGQKLIDKKLGQHFIITAYSPAMYHLRCEETGVVIAVNENYIKQYYSLIKDNKK